MSQGESRQPSSTPGAASATNVKKWRPLSRRQRRVVGVLVEKAKTTPESYPMSLNAVMVGCNQKTNRSPLMTLTQDEVEQILDQLRQIGVVIEVHGGGRVPKYKHLMYEWLGVDKVELAVMTELLLRGEQTVGELRGRAARMEPISDVSTLRPVLESLIAKGLVLELTPEGRGQIVTHNLYEPQELSQLRERIAAEVSAAATASATPTSAVARADQAGTGALASTESVALVHEEVEQLVQQLGALREEVAELRTRLSEVEKLLQ